ncbi:NADH dehydrogenase [ubiquinone] 1 alpha subcomplex subunit 5-like [Physella acuta]|uniref:NADH dehydrogenase [ubiquinone] 1 alpha subcomplex subunit 5-like n=1 Tax=Physella acuta TaxID=109671 RepID=UPI0027DCCBBE|nr:NADH dehydrogenase [ubiquinone] 1 alpha subcomplex subunit 5-like [Physella acuta]
MAGVNKITTGLTGLAVSKHPHQSLGVLYSTILGVLQKMPKSKINCGQIQEVIKQAERELSLARKMLLWKPWEPLVGQAPPN